VIPNDIPGSIFAGPLPVRGVWGQYPQSECFATPYLAESPVHIIEWKKTLRQNRRRHLFGGWALLWTHIGILTALPRLIWLVEMGSLPLPQEPEPHSQPFWPPTCGLTLAL